MQEVKGNEAVGHRTYSPQDTVVHEGDGQDEVVGKDVKA